MLGEYRIERTIGQGGFGITYLASDTLLNAKVVIKENLPFVFAYRESGSMDVRSRAYPGQDNPYQWALERFLDEARTLAALNHPHIVKVMRFIKSFNTAYFVMPYIEGASLDKYCGQPDACSESRLHTLLRDLLSALSYLHGKDILHRDIKPSNILLTKEGYPQLIDFGTARHRISEKTQTITESEGYTPLEQMQRHGNTGPWSDLYALGCTLYKLITGETPPTNRDRTAKVDPLVPLAGREELKGRYSESFLAGIDKAMNFWPEDRWQSAEEWRNTLSTGEKEEQPRLPPGNKTLSSPPDKPKAGKNEESNTVCIPPPTSIPEDADGLYNMGRKLMYGGGGLQNKSKAFDYYRRAATMGHSQAQCALADCYAHGHGTEQDMVAARSWYTKSAEQGNAHARAELNKLDSQVDNKELLIVYSVVFFLFIIILCIFYR